MSDYVTKTNLLSALGRFKENTDDLYETKADANDLKNALSTSFTMEDDVITIPADVVARISSVTSEDDLYFTGNNIFDQTTRVTGKIKNDSGNEVDDPYSNYFSYLIPVHGRRIKANFDIQRFYTYKADKTFKNRTSSPRTAGDITWFASDVYWVQVQVEVSKMTGSMCMVYGDEDTTYSAFSRTSTFTNMNENMSIYGETESTIEVVVSAMGIKGYVPSVGEYPVWEPTTTTDDYSCTPLGQFSQSISALTNTLKYQGFLDTYFNYYLGEYSDGYSVTRRDYGLDSGAEATGNYASPIFVYDFHPKFYNKTILLSAGMNTCEPSTYFGIAFFIKSLMEHTDDGMLALYKTTRFIILPVICPSGIAHSPLLYYNSNGVRINKNFEYYGSWDRLHSDHGGAYPDSEIETKILKQWLNDYAGADFWLDCHSDTDSHALVNNLGMIFVSDSTISATLATVKTNIISFYRNKGYYDSGTNPSLDFIVQTKALAGYPKTVYGYDVTRIHSAMMEQFAYTTNWGSDGNTNNDSYAIKNYVTMIRSFVLAVCKDSEKYIEG